MLYFFAPSWHTHTTPPRTTPPQTHHTPHPPPHPTTHHIHRHTLPQTHPTPHTPHTPHTPYTIPHNNQVHHTTTTNFSESIHDHGPFKKTYDATNFVFIKKKSGFAVFRRCVWCVVCCIWCVCGVCVGCVMVLCTIKKFRQVQGINCIVKRLVGSRLTRIRSLATTNAEISASVLIFCAVAWRKQQGAIVLPFAAMTHSANK